MLISTEMDNISSSYCCDEFKVHVPEHTFLTDNLNYIINIPENISFCPMKRASALESQFVLNHSTFISVGEQRNIPPSPTPSEMRLNVHDLSQTTPEVKIQITADDNTEIAKGRLNRYTKNMSVTICRNLLSVAIPTAMREYVRRAVLPVLFKDIPHRFIPTMGGIAAGLPIALQLFAITRDICRGTQTPETLCARLTNILLVLGTGSALVATGGMAAATNALIAAIFVYVPLRDIAQYVVMLKDNNKNEFHFSPTVKSAVSYAGNQIAVDQGMEILSNALTPFMGPVVANMVGRAIMNTVGETGDELTYRGFSASQQKNPSLELSLHFRSLETISLETAIDQIANTLTSRACIFSASFSSAFAAPFGGVLNSMLVGVTMGSGYVPFIYAHAQKTAKNAKQVTLETQRLDDMEAGRLPH